MSAIEFSGIQQTKLKSKHANANLREWVGMEY